MCRENSKSNEIVQNYILTIRGKGVKIENVNAYINKNALDFRIAGGQYGIIKQKKDGKNRETD